MRRSSRWIIPTPHTALQHSTAPNTSLSLANGLYGMGDEALGSCVPQIISPTSVTWNGDDCDTFSIEVPASDKVLHYKELLNIEVMNGVYYAHSEAVSKADVCTKILSRERGWTMKTAMLANMFPMLTDSMGNTFYIMTQKSNLWKAVSHTDLWGKDAVFIGFDRTKNEPWTRDSGYVERLCAMFFPHGDALQQQYAPSVYNETRPGAGLFSTPIQRRSASVNWDEMLKTSKEWTSKYAGDDVANKLKWHEESGEYAILAHTFYDTMRAIERVSLAKKQKFPHSFVFLIAGEPQRALDIVLKIVAGVASTVVLAFTGVSIPPAAIEGLLQAIVAFAEGRGGIDQLLLSAIDVAVTLALGSGKDGKPLFGEQTRAIIEEAYKVARVAITTKDPARIAAVLAAGLTNLGNKGVLPNPLKDIRDSKGNPIPLLDAAMNFGFEQIRIKAGTDIEQTSQYLTNLVKSSTDFRLSMNQALSAIKKGGESVEKAFNAAVDRVGKIVESGGTSILDDQLLRNAFSTALNGGTLSTGATLGNVAAAVMNIPELRAANADSAEAIQSFAGLVGGFGFNPHVFDQMQFSGFMKGAEEAVKKNLPFSLPSQLMSAFPEKADDYRIKLEKCFNVAIAESTNRDPQFAVPEMPSAPPQDPAASAPPQDSVTDANNIVRNPQGQILGAMTPQGFQPLRSTPIPAGVVSPISGKKGETFVRSMTEIKKYAKRGWQIPPFVRVIQDRPFICLDKLTVKAKNEEGKEQPTDIRKCVPFLGDDILSDAEMHRAVTDYYTNYLPSGKPRTRPVGAQGLADAVQSDAAHPIGLQIACVAEAMLRENISEAALRQLYDNLPNERMTSRSASSIGDEGVVHFEKYSRTALAGGGTAPLGDLQRDYSAIFVWVAVEDAGRNCFQDWTSRNFIRNAQILDAPNVPQSGMYTLNDVWKNLADGGAKPGAIFVRVMPDGKPHTGLVLKKDGDFLETIEANALQNTGRGTDATLQRFRIPLTEVVGWKFFHVWDDSTVGGLRRPLGGRCCVVPETVQTGATFGRPDPLQQSPKGTGGGWIPTEPEEMRDSVLRAARAAVFTYHTPQIHNGANAAVYWKAVRIGISTSLVPKRVPQDLDELGWELNPEPFAEPLLNYEYKPEGVIRYAYRRRVYTQEDYAKLLKLKLMLKSKQQKGVQHKGLPTKGFPLGTRSRFGVHDDDGLSDDALSRQVSCVAKDVAKRYPTAQALVQTYGSDSLLNRYSSSDNTCAMYVWLFYQDLASCMGANASSCRFPKSSRVFDQDSTRSGLNDNANLNKSLFHGAIAQGIQPTRTPEIGAIGCKPRRDEEAVNASRNIPRDGIKGKGGHAFVVTDVTPQGFTTSESSNNAGEGNSSLTYTRTYTNAEIQSRGIWFLPVQSCMLSGTPPQNAPSYCCAPPPSIKPPEPNTVTSNICTEAQPGQLDPDCRIDASWVRANQNEQRDPAFAYSPQGCWKCEKIRATTNTCNEPEPTPDPDCASIWIKRSPNHTVDTNRFKYSGQCWYCERKSKPPERNPQCPPSVPPGLGTGWENVPAGASCNDTANYDYFKTSTGLCCFRKPKKPQTPKTPEIPKTPETPPETVVESGGCYSCEENSDVWNEYEEVYDDWDKKIIIPAWYHTKQKLYFGEIGGLLYPVYGNTLEVEEIEKVTPPSFQRDVQNIQTMIARTEAGEPNAVEGLKILVTDLSKKVDAMAIQNAALDTGVLNTIVQDVQGVKTSIAQARSLTPLDTKGVDAIVSQVVGKLQNFPATAQEAKLTAMETAMQQAIQTIQNLPEILKETQEAGTNAAKATALKTAQTFTATAPPIVAEAVAKATSEAVSQIPPNATPPEAARIVTDAAVKAAQSVAATFPPKSPEAAQAAAAATTVAESAAPIANNAIIEVQRTVPAAVDNTELKRDVEQIKKILLERSASECVGELVKKMSTITSKLESAAKAPEALAQAKQLQSMLAPVVVQMETKHKELLDALNSNAQATVKATAQAASQAAQAAAKLPAVIDDLKANISASAGASSTAQAQQTKLLEAILNDVQARQAAGADVKALVPHLEALQAATAQSAATGASEAASQATEKAVEKALQSLVATMQSVPAPPRAVQEHYDEYNAQIPVLMQYLEGQRKQLAMAALQKNRLAQQRAMLNYWNMHSYYQQQCSTCPSCSNAVGFY